MVELQQAAVFYNQCLPALCDFKKSDYASYH